MHKFFAKTLFIGKNVVFLPHCHSTNEVGKSLTKSAALTNGSIIMTDYQASGKGQQGNVWVSEKGKNLLFTVCLSGLELAPSRQYLLNVATAVAIQKCLTNLLPESKIEIKWPNDIYVNDRKIAGILIETTISGSKLDHVFCGIGLNVNQSHFSLHSATSMLMESSHQFDRDAVLEALSLELENALLDLKNQPDSILNDYLACLRWRGESRAFLIDGMETKGVIVGIDDHGKLILQTNGILRHFAMKEISFIN